jgi:hypothetical protein
VPEYLTTKILDKQAVFSLRRILPTSSVVFHRLASDNVVPGLPSVSWLEKLAGESTLTLSTMSSSLLLLSLLLSLLLKLAAQLATRPRKANVRLIQKGLRSSCLSLAGR